MYHHTYQNTNLKKIASIFIITILTMGLNGCDDAIKKVARKALYKDSQPVASEVKAQEVQNTQSHTEQTVNKADSTPASVAKNVTNESAPPQIDAIANPPSSSQTKSQTTQKSEPEPTDFIANQPDTTTKLQSKPVAKKSIPTKLGPAAEQSSNDEVGPAATEEEPVAETDSDSEKPMNRTATVSTNTGSMVVIRQEPSQNGNKIGNLADGERVTVLASTKHCEVVKGARGCWLKVRSADGIEGYSFSGYMHYN